MRDVQAKLPGVGRTKPIALHLVEGNINEEIDRGYSHHRPEESDAWSVTTRLTHGLARTEVETCQGYLVPKTNTNATQFGLRNTLQKTTHSLFPK